MAEHKVYPAPPFYKYCIQYASIALIYYDYILTFPMEVQHIWRSKFRISTLLYIFSRYALVANVLYLVAVMQSVPQVCDVWYRAIGALSCFGRLSVLIVFTGRTYAIWNQNKYILALLGSIGVASMVLDAVRDGLLSSMELCPLTVARIPRNSCTYRNFTVTEENVQKSFATLLSVFLTAIELLTAILTVWHAVRSSKIKSFKSRNLTGLILRQGALYFCGAFFLTFASMMLNFLAKDNVLIKLLNAIVLPFSCLLTSRFLLQLRSYAADPTAHTSFASATPSRTQASLVNFNNFGVDELVQEFGEAARRRRTAAGRAQQQEQIDMIDLEDSDNEAETQTAPKFPGPGRRVEFG